MKGRVKDETSEPSTHNNLFLKRINEKMKG